MNGRHGPSLWIKIFGSVLGLLWTYLAIQIIIGPVNIVGNTTPVVVQYNATILLLSITTLLLFIILMRYNLRRRAHEYQKLFEANPNPMWIYDLATYAFLEVNDAAVHQYGYSRNEFLSRTIKDIRPPEDLPRLQAAVEKDNSGFYTSGVWRHIKKNGQLIWVEIASTPVEWHGRRAELILAHNVNDRIEYQNMLHELNQSLEKKVTERTHEIAEANNELKTLNEELVATNEELHTANEQLVDAQQKILDQAEALVRQSRDKLNRIVFSIKDIVWSGKISRHKVKLDFVNRAIEDIYGYSLANFYHNETILYDSIIPEDRPIIDELIVQLIRGSYGEVEYRIRDNSNTLKHLFVRLWKQERSSAGNLYVDGIISDITQRKAQEEEKARLLNQLIEQNNDLVQFSFIASHNLRGPVATLMGLSGLVNRESIKDPELNTLFQHIETSITKLDEVTRDLSQILEIRRDGHKPREVIDLREIIFTVTTNLADQINATKADVQIYIDRLPILYTIKSYLYSILYNLIANAIKYRSRQTPIITITAYTENQQGIIVIEDNGMGLDVERFREKIFTLYQRFHTHIPGKGLGLYLVKTQVTALQGNITVNSTIEKGTQFTIQFPQDSISVP